MCATAQSLSLASPLHHTQKRKIVAAEVVYGQSLSSAPTADKQSAAAARCRAEFDHHPMRLHLNHALAAAARRERGQQLPLAAAALVILRLGH